MKKITHNLLMPTLLLLTSGWVMAQGEFITTWKTDNPGTSNDNQITIPTEGVGYNYSIDWGDGNTDDNVAGDMTHTYASAGTYEVSITGDFPRIYFAREGDAEKVLSIEQWGDIAWTSMERAFDGCKNMVGNATDAPNLANVTNMNNMFALAHAFSQDLDIWDVSNVTLMRAVFFQAKTFNGNISNWNVSNVTEMASMFSGAIAFNRDITNWDVSKVTDFDFMFANAVIFDQPIGSWATGEALRMERMFNSAIQFNQDLNDWDVSNVFNMRSMFSNAESFNGNISDWDVSSLVLMLGMFENTDDFNQNINNWDVSNVTTMRGAFFESKAFDQPLNNWDVSKVTDMTGLFFRASIFNQTLTDWDVSNVVDMLNMFRDTDNFNGDISDWDVSKVTRTTNMFLRAASFNQDIGEWDVSAVTEMPAMFQLAASFDRNIGDWDVSSVTNMTDIFTNSGLSTTSYDNTLTGWSQLTLQPNVPLGATATSYCNGAAARAILTSGPNNWTITDAGENCRPFITTWETTTDGEQITIPTTGAGYNYTVDWGDGSSNGNVMGDISYTYASAGTHTITISGDFPRIFFNNSGDKEKILTIEQWGDLEWTSMENAFNGCSNLTVPATDAPNLTDVTSMFVMFRNAVVFNSDVNGWDVSNVTSMRAMFVGAVLFNQPLNNWDVSNVTDMNSMFYDARAFNGDISGWDVSKVEDMNSMFFDARDFNQPLDNWDVSAVTEMQSMFNTAREFNQDIGDWDVSSVVDMGLMFANCLVFNQDLSNWDVSGVTNMDRMFTNAQIFNVDLSLWNISQVTNMSRIFESSSLSTVNYDKILQGWAAQTVQSGVVLGVGGVTYCLGEASRNILASGPNNWVIDDGGVNCVVNIPDANFKAALLADASINTTDDGEITFQEAEAFTGRIFIYNKSITDLTGIQAFTNIDRLSAGRNNINQVDLSTNVAMTMLELNENDLTTIDLSNNTNLTLLGLDKNPLASLDLSMNGNLTTVSLFDTDLTTIDFSLNTMLDRVTVSNSNISSIELNSLSNLTILDLRNNFLTEIDVSNNSNLEILAVSFNQLELIDLSNNGSLREIQATDNLLTSLDVSNGNNSNIVNSDFKLTNNPDLKCITVDDVTYSEATWINIDDAANFSTDCSNISTETDILTFNFPDFEDSDTIDPVNHTIDVLVGFMADPSSLIADFTLSSGATSDPVSGTAQDFSTPFVYSITAEDGTTTQEWTLTVEVQNVGPEDITLEDGAPINENNAIDELVGIFSTVDGNTVDSHTYDLVAGTGDSDNASFDISGDNLMAKEVFDFETKPSYSIRVRTTDAGGLSFEKQFSIVINDLSGAVQSITFGVLDEVNVNGASFDLTASTSSGLEVSYTSSDVSVATILGSTVTIVGTGATTITASQAGDGDYAAATDVAQMLTVNKLDQSITFSTIQDQIFENGSFTLSATASSGLAVSYEVVNGSATITGDVVIFTDLGTVTISASQVGDDAFSAATSVEQSFDVVTVTGFEGKEVQTNVQVFPNPVRDVLHINLGSKQLLGVFMTDLKGKQLEVSRSGTSVNTTSLKGGYYLLTVVTDQGTSVQQIIKQ